MSRIVRKFRYENDGKVHLDVDSSGRFGLQFSNFLDMANSLSANVRLVLVVGSEK